MRTAAKNINPTHTISVNGNKLTVKAEAGPKTSENSLTLGEESDTKSEQGDEIKVWVTSVIFNIYIFIMKKCVERFCILRDLYCHNCTSFASNEVITCKQKRLSVVGIDYSSIVVVFVCNGFSKF